jgi:tRNA-specific 2-thiouridylase
VLCNSHIKWGELVRVADELQCDYIATGHYARIEERDGHVYLAQAADTKKDQTYFLWMLTEEQLRRTIFPLGDLTKDQVRDIARQHGYESLAQKRESQEICFIPNDDYRAFLRANVPDYEERVRAGEYINAEGKVLGHHEGFVNYTIGQRKGLGIALGHPAYITHIDPVSNRITLGSNDDMYATELMASFPRTPRIPRTPSSPLTAKVRYRSTPVPVETINGNCISFATPVWGITPGQSVVLYCDDLVVGGGIILGS